jgi:hypothetical protein
VVAEAVVVAEEVTSTVLVGGKHCTMLYDSHLQTGLFLHTRIYGVVERVLRVYCTLYDFYVDITIGVRRERENLRCCRNRHSSRPRTHFQEYL